MEKEKTYLFNHYETALTAFVGVFENRLNNIYPKIPVFVLDTGDETFLMQKKFEENDKKEIYLKVPRCVLNIGEATFQTDQDSSQYNIIKYLMPSNTIYQAKFRRKATTVPIALEFVCSNYIKGLEYLEVLQSLMSNENVFSYEFLGNTYPASYKSDTFILEKNTTDSSSNKNCVIKLSVDLNLQVMIIWYNSIKLIGKNNDINFGGLKTEFDIVAKFKPNRTKTPPDYETTIKPE